MSRGQVGKARRRVVSHGVADMGDSRVREAVKAKYLPRSHAMPTTLLSGTCLEAVPGLQDVLQNLRELEAVPLLMMIGRLGNRYSAEAAHAPSGSTSS